jgi:hypothetical protein
LTSRIIGELRRLRLPAFARERDFVFVLRPERLPELREVVLRDRPRVLRRVLRLALRVAMSDS